MQLSDWYSVSRKSVVKSGGRTLFSRYVSLDEALRAIYPEYAWESTRFAEEGGKASNGFWNDPQNQRQILDKVGLELGVQQVHTSPPPPSPRFMSSLISHSFLSSFPHSFLSLLLLSLSPLPSSSCQTGMV